MIPNLSVVAEITWFHTSLRLVFHDCWHVTYTPSPLPLAPVMCRCIRGYIAMLAVEKEYRGHGLGSTLARYAIETMVLKNCDEVVLETEITNSGAAYPSPTNPTHRFAKTQ